MHLFFGGHSHSLEVFVSDLKKSIRRPLAEPVDGRTVHKCRVHTNTISVADKITNKKIIIIILSQIINQIKYLKDFNVQ